MKFLRGGAYVEVTIDNRTITFVTPLLNFVPLKIDLDKLSQEKSKISSMQLDNKMLRQLSKLKTEEDMKKDLIKDLKQTGWRVAKIE